MMNGEAHIPNELDQLNVSASDVLAMLGFEAQRIASAVGQHAAGYPFPSPAQMQEVLDKMQRLNTTLMRYAAALAVQTESATDIAAKADMKVQLN